MYKIESLCPSLYRLEIYSYEAKTVEEERLYSVQSGTRGLVSFRKMTILKVN